MTAARARLARSSALVTVIPIGLAVEAVFRAVEKPHRAAVGHAALKLRGAGGSIRHRRRVRNRIYLAEASNLGAVAAALHDLSTKTREVRQEQNSFRDADAVKPLLIVSGFVVASAVGVGAVIGPMLKAPKDDGPATTQSISQPAQQGDKGKQAAAAAAAVAAPAPAPAPAPAVTPRKGYTYKSFNVEGNYIAMTFDDGPNPETTPQLLQILRERNIKATFFVLGNMVAKHPEVLKMISDEGHEIGSHSWSHPQLTRISQAGVDKELGNTSEAIFQVTGKKPIYLRPPYGSMKPALRTYIEDKYGLTIVNWAVDPNDWKNRNSQAVYDAIIAQVKPGAIVLAHDIYPTTVAAMPRVLDDLIAKGYKFGTISDLVAMDKVPKVTLAALPANGAKPGAQQKTAQKPKPKDGATASAAPKPAAGNPAAPKPQSSQQPAQQQRAAGVY